MGIISVEIFSMEKFLYLVKHGLHVAEGTVNAGKADIGDLIHKSQMVHYQLADNAAWYFLFPKTIQLLLNVLDRIFNFTCGQWALLTGLAQPNVQLLPIEWLSPLISFDYHQVEFFDAFIGAKASFALFALAASMDGVADIS